MISSVLTLLLAASAAQASDTTRSAREAYTACLRGFVQRSLDSGMEPAAFATQFPQQCGQQEQAFRQAVIRRDTASRMSRADAEESATMEIDDAKLNMRERYEMARPAPAAQQAAAAPAAAPPTGTPQATPASATTTPQ